MPEIITTSYRNGKETRKTTYQVTDEQYKNVQANLAALQDHKKQLQDRMKERMKEYKNARQAL